MAYRGITIDGSTFKSKADIDNFLRVSSINRFMDAVELFMTHRDYAHAELIDTCAARLVNDEGMTWDEVEALEAEVARTA